jgi:uncharacterized surface protein with fasciclin (FAS1) repeats
MKYKDSKKFRFLLLAIFLIVIGWGCHEDITDLEKYKSPAWLKGKLFTQLKAQEDLNIFISCLEKTGYDTILNTSGSYTVFAPTDEAFQKFFQDNTQYNSIEDIPVKDLDAMVRYHIIYNAWTERQFQTLDVSGWIDPDNELSKPRAYKRATLFYEENKKFPVKRIGSYYKIVDSLEATNKKLAFTEYNKYCPIFFQNFFDVYDLNYNDYEFYFNRSFDPGKIYYADAEVISQEIPAENGYIYKIDRVVTPLPNGETLLEKGSGDYSYRKFLDMVHSFSEFYVNFDATYDQPGAEEGLAVDTLYNLLYPDLIFNIHNELTVNNDPRSTYGIHHGLMAPTDQALESFLNEYLSMWGDYKDLPELIKRLIVNSYMSKDVIYKTDINRGFINGLNDSIIINEDNIIQKIFGSNCTFFGLNKAIVPRVITSVCRPLYLTRDFETMMYACEDTRLLSALKKQNANFGFYLPPDLVTGRNEGDSSLIRVITNYELDQYYYMGVSRQKDKKVTRSVNEMRNQILNQITETTPDGSADKEFLKTLGGNYIIVNNIDGTAQGTSTSKYGYEGTEDITIYPKPYQGYTDNGKVFTVNGWFYFYNIVSFTGLIISRYPEFLALLEKAGLYDPVYFRLNFLIDGEFYTAFIPTAQALNDYRVDTLTVDELRDFLKFHFVRGDLIFTDGKKPSGYYPTILVDESSTTYNTVYSSLNIRPRPNSIEILDKNGDVYLNIHENGEFTNKFIAYQYIKNSTTPSSWDYIITGVVHEVDKVLREDLLDPN